MRATEAFAAAVREQFRRLVDELPQDAAAITETSETGLLRLRLDPKRASSSPLEITIEDGGCTVFIGAHGRFEHLNQDANLIASFVRAALRGRVSETVWEWKGKPLRAITKVQIDEIPYTHDWSSLLGMLAKLIFGPWVKRREIQYRPYAPSAQTS